MTPETPEEKTALCSGGEAKSEPTHAGEAGHGDAGHDHGVNPNADRRYLLTALILLVAFMITEVVVALVSGSLALLSDAGPHAL